MKKILMGVGLVVILVCGWLFLSASPTQPSTERPSTAQKEELPPQPTVDININLNQYLENTTSTKQTIPSTKESTSDRWITIGVVAFNLIVIALLMRRMRRNSP